MLLPDGTETCASACPWWIAASEVMEMNVVNASACGVGAAAWPSQPLRKGFVWAGKAPRLGIYNVSLRDFVAAPDSSMMATRFGGDVPAYIQTSLLWNKSCLLGVQGTTLTGNASAVVTVLNAGGPLAISGVTLARMGARANAAFPVSAYSSVFCFEYSLASSSHATLTFQDVTASQLVGAGFNSSSMASFRDTPRIAASFQRLNITDSLGGLISVVTTAPIAVTNLTLRNSPNISDCSAWPALPFVLDFYNVPALTLRNVVMSGLVGGGIGSVMIFTSTAPSQSLVMDTVNITNASACYGVAAGSNSSASPVLAPAAAALALGVAKDVAGKVSYAYEVAIAVTDYHVSDSRGGGLQVGTAYFPSLASEVIPSITITMDMKSCSFERVITQVGNNFGGGAALTIYASPTTAAASLAGAIVNTAFNDGQAAGSGGAISMRFVSGTLRLLDCWFRNNSARGAGGAIALEQSALQLARSHFIANKASVGGGAISVVYATLDASESEFLSNVVSGPGGGGGAVRCLGGIMRYDLTSAAVQAVEVPSYFLANVATGAGGAIAADGC